MNRNDAIREYGIKKVERYEKATKPRGCKIEDYALYHYNFKKDFVNDLCMTILVILVFYSMGYVSGVLRAMVTILVN